MKPCFPESHEQQQLVKWWRLAHRGLGVPHEGLLFAVPHYIREAYERGEYVEQKGPAS
jgi:hypothetical protein